jgi:hypothetical protein
VTGPVSKPNPQLEQHMNSIWTAYEQHMNSILESQRYGEIRHILPDSEGHLSPQKSDSQNCDQFGDAEDACGTLTWTCDMIHMIHMIHTSCLTCRHITSADMELYIVYLWSLPCACFHRFLQPYTAVFFFVTWTDQWLRRTADWISEWIAEWFAEWFVEWIDMIGRKCWASCYIPWLTASRKQLQ